MFGSIWVLLDASDRLMLILELFDLETVLRLHCHEAVSFTFTFGQLTLPSTTSCSPVHVFGELELADESVFSVYVF